MVQVHRIHTAPNEVRVLRAQGLDTYHRGPLLATTGLASGSLVLLLS